MAKIKIGGKEVEFKKLDMNDLIVLEERFGGLTEMTAKGTLTMKETRTLVWLLVRKETGMTEDEVGATLIPSDESFAEIMGSITAAATGDAPATKN